jgi:hypothetical protein
LHQKKVIHVVPENTPVKGEIGEFIFGLLTSSAYYDAVGRSVIIGPMSYGSDAMLEWIDRNGNILYSSHVDIARHPYGKKLSEVERKFGVSLVYAHLPFSESNLKDKRYTEVILIDAHRADLLSVNALKAWLFDEFRIESIRYEKNREYETCVKFTPAALAALRAIGAADPSDPGVLISHDYMGLPTILAAIMDPLGSYKTVFYAHQVATARRIVESYPGHDTMFYKALNCSKNRDYYLSDVFGPQDFFFQSPLIQAAQFCDNILAASDRVAQELRFLDPNFHNARIDISYCGLPGISFSLQEKMESRDRLQEYTRQWMGYKPDYIFTHSSQMGLNKGLWRDLRVLEHLDPVFEQQGKSGVLFLLNTISCRNVEKYEESWKWPLDYRQKDILLPDSEAAFYAAVQAFNTGAKNIKVILVDPIGLSHYASESSRTIDMFDIRKGSDVEFGQSIYEPFGRTTLESLCYGGISVFSSVCGSLGFLKHLVGKEQPDNIIVADYTKLDNQQSELDSLESILSISQSERDVIEAEVSREIAHMILDCLPTSQEQLQSRIQWGIEFAEKHNWDSICRKYFLPALNHAYHRRRVRQIA